MSVNITSDIVLKLMRYKEKYLKFIAVAYVIIVLYLTLFSYERYETDSLAGGRVNLNFFKVKIYYWQHSNIYRTKEKLYMLREVFGNFALFMPLSWVLSVFLKKQFTVPVLFYIVVISVLSIELLQWIFKIGTFDVDDLVLNIFGGLTGIILRKLLLNK